LYFELFFVPNNCVEIQNDYGEYNASDSGGRIVAFKKNKILFSTGTFRYRDLAQELNSELGKILAIDKNTAQAKIVSMGHRNVMGLSYLKETQEIWSTEHGPNGGDEININKYQDNGDIKNFGWPISSYGEHYSASTMNPEGALIVDTNDKTYLKAPLYKSHIEHGFVEPEQYFVPSIGISAITATNKSLFNNEGFNIIFGSKGNNVKVENEKTIFLFNPQKKSMIKIFSGERVRDILYIPNSSQIIFTGETNGVIGIISNK
jgi:glucose/arabinose dehydrogenase